MKDLSLNQFVGLYSTSKTLRFELKPQGQTLNWIEQRGFLDQDEHRAESYKVVKKIIDFYHKHFIDEALLQLPVLGRNAFVEGLENYRSLMGKNDATLKKKMEKVQEGLRKSITSLFDTKRLFGKELIKEDLMAYLYECEHNGEELPEGMSIDECKAVISEFNEFTSYFTGFHENRKNMYSHEDKSTAIAYRLIHDNLPKFIVNMEVWAKIKEVLSSELTQLEKDMSVELNNTPLDAYFEDLSIYVYCLRQCDIDRYNTLIGGRSEGNRKVQGLNEYINLYNQKVDRKERLPKMTELYKMILSDRGTLSWLPDMFTDDNQLLEAVSTTYNEIYESIFEGNNDAISLKDLMASLSDFPLDGIFVKNDTTLTSVVKQAYGEWDMMAQGLAKAYDTANPIKKQSLEKHEEKRKKWIDSFDSFSLSDICHYTGSKAIVEWYEGLWSKENVTAFEQVENAYNDVKDLINTTYKGNLKEDSRSIELLKELLDALKNLQRLASTLKGNGDETSRDGGFYAEWERLMEVLNQVTPLYNMVRNYVTQKAYSEEKFKLNFSTPQLLSGWDQNKEKDYLGILLRKEGLYYLGIMDKKSKKSFDDELPHDGECYEKMDYKFFKDLTKMIPKCSTQINAVKNHFKTSDKDYVLFNDNFNQELIISKEIFDLNNVTYDNR